MKRIYRIVTLLMAFMLVFSQQALAEETAYMGAQIIPVKTDNAYGSVSYPVLQGHEDAFVQTAINSTIFEKAQIQTRLDTLNNLAEGGWGLVVSYQSAIYGSVLSVAVSAYGEMENGRMGHTYTALSFDMATGRQLTAEDLFSDAEGAFARMEEIMENDVQPILSGYTENNELTPVPRDNFYMTDDYVTFYYPEDQFSMLSGYSGGASFGYYELVEYLNLSEDGVLYGMGAADSLEMTDNTASLINQAVTAGTLPGVGAKIGDSLIQRLNEYRLLVDPDYYPGGRFFEVEAPEFRSIWLLTDALTESYDASQVLGIRADRLNLYGIRTGITTIEEWREALGQPESTLEMDESMASDYRLPPGTSDYYTFGGNKLRLHADETGVLVSVQLGR